MCREFGFCIMAWNVYAEDEGGSRLEHGPSCAGAEELAHSFIHFYFEDGAEEVAQVLPSAPWEKIFWRGAD
jgi:hypothetical protein